MKNISTKYLQIILVFAILIASGCTDNLIEEPQSIIAPETYYQSNEEFDAAINGVLAAFVGGWSGFGFNAPHQLCSGAEDYTSRESEASLIQYDKLETDPTARAVNDVWGALYRGINTANIIIARAPLAEEVAEEDKLKYEALGRYLRGLQYFYLTRWFGEVIIVTYDNVSDAKDLEQSSVSDIYNTMIIPDLEFAEQHLPLDFPGKALPNKAAAKGLLAEVYLNMAGWPLEDVSKYALARDKAKEVMDMDMYSLEPNFKDLWYAANKFTNSEFIFFYNADADAGANASFMHIAQRPGEEGGWNDLFSEARWFYAFPDGPRKDGSFWTTFDDGNDTYWTESMMQQPFIAKYRDAGPAASLDVGPINSWSGSGMVCVTRYAEILLTYAEAANMAEGGPSAAAYEAINEVRRRAGGYDQSVYPDLPAGLSQADFDEAVIAERGWELSFELKRWFDLVRRKMVVEVNKDLHPNVTADKRWLPKPATEVKLIEGLKQNDGY